MPRTTAARVLLALVVLLGLAAPVAAEEFDRGLAAAQRGDYTPALQAWQPLVAQGHAEAQFSLGLLYYNGHGVPLDHTRAVSWWLEAAEQGLEEAQYNLGFMYIRGRGIEQDYQAAAKWWLMAATRGHGNALNGLGTLYQDGHGVPQDYVSAHSWFNIAAARLPDGADRKRAVKNRALVAGRMTVGQIAEAQRLARKWSQKVD